MSGISTRKTKTELALTDMDTIIIDDNGNRLAISEDQTMPVNFVLREAFDNEKIVVGSAAPTPLRIGDPIMPLRRLLVVQPKGTIYIGNSSVTVANGLEITEGETVRILSEIEIYAIASADVDVVVIEAK